MLVLMAYVIFAIAMAVVLMALFSCLSKKYVLTHQYSSPFECGFSPQSAARSPFSIHFFLVAIIFLLFDVELICMFPVFIAEGAVQKLEAPFLFVMFIIIIGTAVE